MKKYLLFILLIGTLFFTGCGINEKWSGAYKNESNYSILIYTKDEKIASVMVKEKGANYEFYPIQYSNHFEVSETKLTTKTGESVTIEKNGNQITIKCNDSEKGVWEKIEGTYTKYKNSKAFNTNQF
mgnify:CR=1 FL=1